MENETSLEIIAETSTELSIVIARINELHAKAEELAKQAKEVAGKTIETALECGKLLIQEKAKVSYGKWEEWCDTNLKFDIRTAQNYMRLYRKSCDLCGNEPSGNGEVADSTETKQNESVSFLEQVKPKNLRQAYIATGILPQPTKVDEDTDDKITPLVVHVKHIDFVVKWYRNTVEQNPAKNWKWIEREALINDLTPLMEIYNELIDLQEKAQKEQSASLQN